jgi:2TM domain
VEARSRLCGDVPGLVGVHDGVMASGIGGRAQMSNDIPEHELESTPQDLRAEARRWVRRKRILYSILGIYAVLSLMWFAIDMADGTESLWFYWPMLGVGIAVAVTSVVLLGVGGLFGVGWEQRQIDRYLQRRGRADRTS